MTAPVWTKSVGARVALSALVVSIVVTGWSVTQALRVEALLRQAATPLLRYGAKRQIFAVFCRSGAATEGGSALLE